jgi:hypothetical protein
MAEEFGFELVTWRRRGAKSRRSKPCSRRPRRFRIGRNLLSPKKTLTLAADCNLAGVPRADRVLVYDYPGKLSAGTTDFDLDPLPGLPEWNGDVELTVFPIADVFQKFAHAAHSVTSLSLQPQPQGDGPIVRDEPGSPLRIS